MPLHRSHHLQQKEAALRRQQRAEKVQELAAAGLSFDQIAAQLGIHRATLLVFCRKNGLASAQCARCGKKSNEPPHTGGDPATTHRFEPRILLRRKNK
jgi:DNA-binding CsgD family transcriptional regulator